MQLPVGAMAARKDGVLASETMADSADAPTMRPTLIDLKFEVRMGELVAVVGAVGRSVRRSNAPLSLSLSAVSSDEPV